MARTRRFLTVMALAAVPLAACASQDADVDEAVDSLVEAGASDEQADCVGRGFEDLSQDDLNEVADAGDLSDLPDELEDQVRTVLDDCFSGGGDSAPEDDGADTSETTETTQSEDGEPSETTETTAP